MMLVLCTSLGLALHAPALTLKQPYAATTSHSSRSAVRMGIVDDTRAQMLAGALALTIGTSAASAATDELAYCARYPLVVAHSAARALTPAHPMLT